jgi:hypothetical protein
MPAPRAGIGAIPIVTPARQACPRAGAAPWAIPVTARFSVPGPLGLLAIFG